MPVVSLPIDEIDKKIASFLFMDPNISQEDISREVGLSQPSVAMRIKKMKKNGVIENNYGINPIKLGLSIAKVDLTTNDTTRVLNLMKNCPYFLNGFIVSGRRNMCLFFVGENITTLEAIVDCHLRKLDDVKNIEFNIVIGAAKKLITPIRMDFGKKDFIPCDFSNKCDGL